MTPSPSAYDYWNRNPPSSAKIQIDCLMPNGIVVVLDTPSDAILSDIKEELWEEARKYPLQGLLKEQSLYNFVCINPMAEKEELINENRRLCDIKPFCNFLKVVECEGDKANQVLNSQIGQLIGKGLHDFDSLKSLEVNDFRYRMKTMVTAMKEKKENMSVLERIKQNFPCDLAESEELPPFLSPKLCDGNMVVSVCIENVNNILPPFSISHTTQPLQLLAMALQKNKMMTGQYPFNPDMHIARDYVLKLCGRQEYLIGDYAISRFLCIRDLLIKEIQPSFVVVPIESVLETEDNMSLYNDLDTKRSSVVRNSTSAYSTLKRKTATISSWKIDDFFSFRIDTVSRLNCDESEVGIQAGIFHGGRSLCEPKKTSVKHSIDGESIWNEELVFDIRVRDVPRAARLCIVVYAVSKMSKGAKYRRLKDIEQEMYINPIAWVNTTIFDYKSELKTGSFTLYMWTYAEDLQNNDIMNPLGTVVSNPFLDHATALTVTFTKYRNDKTCAVYPVMEVIHEVAAQLKASNMHDGVISRISLSESGNSISSAVRGEALAYSEQLRFIAERDPMHEIHEQEKKFLWSLRYDIPHQIPTLLPRLLLCIEWNDYREVAEMLSLLQQWPKLPTARALELLDFAYADAAVRSYAVDCIRVVSDDELLLYLLQLVQALKHESHLECDLVDFLITRALNNRKIGHFLFWHLRSEMQVAAVSVRFGLMLEAYCRGAPDHMKILIRQMESLQKLKEISEMARQRKESRDKLKLLVQETLKENYNFEALSNVLCPLDPALRCKQIRVSKCKTMESKMKPLWLVFENDDPYGQDIYFIFKYGDDLRQDMLTLQMIRIMDRLWKNAGLDLRMNPYGCISTGNRVGLIEVVLNADTIANIQKEKGTFPSAFKKESLLSWLKDHNPTESALNCAVEQFSLSCAGYCVATYVLGIADRHSDNVMVRKNGQLFHIDFGHILGHFKEKFGIRRERVPFVLTHDFVHVITKGSTAKGTHQKGELSEFEKFRKTCEQAFLTLRRHGSFIISLFAMMISTGLPELSSEKDLDYLRDTLVLDLSEQDALRQFRSKFDEALKNSWKTSINWFIHNIATNNRQ